METTTKVATLEHLRPKKYNKLLGIGIGLMLSMLLLAAASTAYLSGIFVSANNDAPQELIVSEITANSARLAWTTNIENIGYIEYGTNPSELTLIAPEVSPTRSHSLDLTLLKANTSYYFHLRVGEKVFDNGGVPWTFATRPEGEVEDALLNQDVKDGSGAPLPSGTTLQGAPADSVPSGGCPATTCDEIRSMLGKGCQTSDLITNSCL